MSRFFNVLLLLFLCNNLLFAQKAYYHTVDAEVGDHISKLLKRYGLTGHSCNFKKFYLLNDLNSTSKLMAGRSYKIPVSIHTYNGKTIRSSLGLGNDWTTATAIKDYNEEILRKGLRQKTITASKILWVPHHLINCKENQKPTIKIDETVVDDIVETKSKPDKIIPTPKKKKEEPEIVDATPSPPPVKSGNRYFEIFGPKHGHIPLKSNKLRNKVYYVVSGHGGPDSGAVGERSGHQLCEDEYAYDVSLRIVRNLLEHGAIAYMITRDENDGLRSGKYLPCDRDERCWGGKKLPWNQKKRLFQRTDAINELFYRHDGQGLKDQTVISVHIDSRSVSQSADVFFYYLPESRRGKSRAFKMHQVMKEKYKKHRANGSYKGTVTPRDLHLLRETKPTSVYIELGNIRNPNDQKRFILESNRQALADWLFEGLTK